MLQQRGSDNLLKCKLSIVLWLLPKQMTQQRGVIMASSVVVSLFCTLGRNAVEKHNTQKDQWSKKNGDLLIVTCDIPEGSVDDG
jgi:hypothetical protein